MDMEDTMTDLRALDGCDGKVGAVAYYATNLEQNIREAPNICRPFMLYQSMRDTWVRNAVCTSIEWKLSPNPLVTLHRYADVDHAFARHGGASYSEPETLLALARSTEFIEKYLKN